MTFVRALLACAHFLHLCAYEMLADCCNSCLRHVSGFTTRLTEPIQNLFIALKALYVLFWKIAFTICSVPWRLWDLIYTLYTASCCMLSRWLSLLRNIPYAGLSLLRHVCSQMQAAALQLLWSWTPGWIQTTCTILAYVWHSTGKEGPADAPPGTASFGFGEFVVTIVRRAKSCPSSIPPSPSGTVEHLTEPLILRLHEIRMALTAVVISTRAVCLKPSLLAVRQLR